MPEQPNRTVRRMFSRRELDSLAGRRAFERGHGYALDGRIHKLKATGEQVDAKVRGSASYQVRLWIEDEEAASERAPARSAGRSDSASTRSR